MAILRDALIIVIDKYKKQGLTDDDINKRLKKIIDSEKIEIVNLMIEKEELENKIKRLDCGIRHGVSLINEAEKYIKENASQ